MSSAASQGAARVADQEKDETDRLHALHVVVAVNRQDRIDQRDALNARVDGWQNVEQMLPCHSLSNALPAVGGLLHTHRDSDEVDNLCRPACVE
eukprot:6175752-Pleurochrysis_carterae.AAC.5